MEGRKLRLKAPSPAMIVALIALVFAMSGTAVAASKLVSGDKLIKKASLSGNRLKKDTVTGTQIKESTLGKVPSATAADTAASATKATNADNATNASHAVSADTAAKADKLGSVGPDVFGTAVRTLGQAFKPVKSDTQYTHVGGWGITWTSGDNYFFYSLNLPQGASLTAYKMYFDNTADGLGAGKVYLYRSNNTTAGTVYAFTPVNTATGVGSSTYTLPTPVKIDNAAYAYGLFWVASTSTVNAFMGAEVDYTLP
jgi:hypothetical protein